LPFCRYLHSVLLHFGNLTIQADAHLRDEKGRTISEEVQAVFIKQSYSILNTGTPAEVIVKAVPHIDLEFEWKDRRAKTGPVSYYNRFIINGYCPDNNGRLIWWRGVTKLIERDGRKYLVVKTPVALQKAVLHLPKDKVVTASYKDATGKTSGPGRVELGGIKKPIKRIIFGDEPTKK